MQFPQRIQPKRPTTRIRRNDPNVVAMRAQLESLSADALRRLEDELRGYDANGVEGAMMKGLVAQAAATEQRLAA
ncbi:MAG: hypothetical protein AAFY81_07470 [Pseudomonadota bacterium]